MRSSLARGPLKTGLLLLAVGLAFGGCSRTGGAAAYAQQSTEQAVKAASGFLARTAKEPGVQVLPDGLEYKVVRSGPSNGPRPATGDDVRVNYEGTLIDGTVFDSSYTRGQPAVFTVGEVVPAWNEALQLMRPGDVWYLYVPPKLGYGSEAQGPIPGNSVMVFKIELISVLPKAGGSASV